MRRIGSRFSRLSELFHASFFSGVDVCVCLFTRGGKMFWSIQGCLVDSPLLVGKEQ
jgi:hypothetical protein